MTDNRPKDARYARALELAQTRRHEEALALVREHLLDHPLDGEALNDAGVLLAALGRRDEAVEHLKAAVGQLEDRRQPLLNLAEVHLAAGRGEEAVDLFDDLHAAGALWPELANRAAAVLLEHDEPARAVEAIFRSMELAPQDEALGPIVEKIRRLRPNVGIFPDRPEKTNLHDLHSFLQRRFRTRLFCGGSEADLAAFLQWCDVAWFQRCSRQAVVVSHLPKICRLVIQLSPREAYLPCLDRLDTSHVDLIVTPGTARVVEVLRRRLGSPPDGPRVEHLPRGVDADRLAFTRRRPGKSIACIGEIDLQSNPMFLIHCLRRLRQVQPGFRLFFAGQFADDLLEPYLRELVGGLGLADAVSFDGWQEDLPGWLADKHYVASADIADRGRTAVLEAMAMGLKPLVHAFCGTDELYPADALFRTEDDFCRRVLRGPYEPRAYRRFVREHFPVARSLVRANELLAELEKLPCPTADLRAAEADAAPPREADG